MLKKSEKVGNIIEEYELGNTTVRINDAYIVKTQEEVNRILERITARAVSVFQCE